MSVQLLRKPPTSGYDGEMWVQVKLEGQKASSEQALVVCCELMDKLDAPFGAIHEIDCDIATEGIAHAVCSCDGGPYIVLAE